MICSLATVIHIGSCLWIVGFVDFVNIEKTFGGSDRMVVATVFGN